LNLLFLRTNNMKLTKKIIDEIEVYFKNGVKKYEHCKSKNSNGYEWWGEYDNKGNEIYYKTSSGYKMWKKYDNRGNNIYSKDNDGKEWWNEYDNKGNVIYFKDSDGKEWRKKDIPEEVEEVEVNIKPFIFK